MRNLNPPKAKNGTRCILKRVLGNVIEAVISVGQYRGETILIPRIPLLPTSVELPFQFMRVQFPIKLCFAMTISKSFKYVGVDLTHNVSPMECSM